MGAPAGPAVVTGTARYAWDMGPGKAHVQAAVVHKGKARSALKTADQAK